MQSELGRTLAAAALVLVATFLWSLIPTRPESYSALVVPGGMRQNLLGRNIDVIVHGVYRSPHISVASNVPNIYTDYYAKGYWVVVDVTCGTLVADTPILAYLHSAGVRTSPRTTVSISKGQPSDFQPGLKYRFPIIFEIPSGSDEMTVSFMNWFKDDRSELTMDAPLDSELEIKIPSNEIQVRPMLTIRGSEVQ